MGQSLDYSKAAFDLIDDLDGLTNVGKVMARLSSTLAEFGYTSFLITGVPEPPQKLEPYILLNGWPKGWTEHYTKSNYYADDPPHRKSLRMVASAVRCKAFATRCRSYERGPRIWP